MVHPLNVSTFLFVLVLVALVIVIAIIFAGTSSNRDPISTVPTTIPFGDQLRAGRSKTQPAYFQGNCDGFTTQLICEQEGNTWNDGRCLCREWHTGLHGEQDLVTFDWQPAKYSTYNGGTTMPAPDDFQKAITQALNQEETVALLRSNTGDFSFLNRTTPHDIITVNDFRSANTYPQMYVKAERLRDFSVQPNFYYLTNTAKTIFSESNHTEWWQDVEYQAFPEVFFRYASTFRINEIQPKVPQYIIVFEDDSVIQDLKGKTFNEVLVMVQSGTVKDADVVTLRQLSELDPNYTLLLSST